MTALSDLYDRLAPAAQANSQQVEVKQAWVDWRAAAEAIVLSYKNFNFLEGPLEGRPELEQMAYRFFILASINALSPLFDGYFREIEVKLSCVSWSSDTCPSPLACGLSFHVVKSLGRNSFVSSSGCEPFSPAVPQQSSAPTSPSQSLNAANF